MGALASVHEFYANILASFADFLVNFYLVQNGNMFFSMVINDRKLQFYLSDWNLSMVYFYNRMTFSISNS